DTAGKVGRRLSLSPSSIRGAANNSETYSENQNPPAEGTLHLDDSLSPLVMCGVNHGNSPVTSVVHSTALRL
ncbi:MAG: hypothetical protein WA637_21465, partial [Terriglobales bacterium]